ncbi:unnamed protein product [Meganyctiphanes norvegica]|uniref:C2H2-type domain-containing protein n=1 Tax=Meganyctiphanes norvegica TaxID=48144 RepID=A0AAV2SJP8_MEGNR
MKHTGKKQFQCSYCNMAFAQNGNLTTHIRKHDVEKPIKSSHCDKVKSNENLSRSQNKGEFCMNISNVYKKKVNIPKINKLETGDESSKNETFHGSEKEKQVKKDKPCTSNVNELSSQDEFFQTPATKRKIASSNINIDKHFSKERKYDSKMENDTLEIFKKEDTKNQAKIEEVILSDSDEVYDAVQESEAMNFVLLSIENIFDLLEKSTEGAWKRTPNKTKQDLYEVLQSLQLEIFENNSNSDIYNLDVNYRQLYIHFSGVDGMLLKHALLCKNSFPSCKNIPDKHQEDMNCCI